MKTSELTGAALDWAVADTVGDTKKSNFVIYRYDPSCPAEPCVREEFDPEGPAHYFNFTTDFAMWTALRYSCDWALGGPLLEQYGIATERAAGKWWATMRHGQARASEATRVECGATLLEAAMRVLVWMNFGDEIEIPVELLS